MSQVHVTLPPGVTIRDPSGNRYTIESLLGRGESDAVYLVRERRLQRMFVLKEVIDPSTQDRERVTFEGEVLKRLKHRALPRIYRIFEHEKLRRVYLLMDYVTGNNLEDLYLKLPAQRFAVPATFTLLAPVVDALSYLHTQKPPIVHRDIKPANIIISASTGETVLVNFGIAKQYIPDATTALIRRGTPGYAAPEHYMGGTSPRTDIYGLGATFYTLLTGVVPPDVIARIMKNNKGSDPLKFAYQLNPLVPEALSETLRRAMAINAAERFATVQEFWWELTRQA
ncbi:MAG: serine/threonine protein kinase [Chloroflexota bacterium]|nr:serine/threonine protein kinase [Chloroflexota bacterium]